MSQCVFCTGLINKSLKDWVRLANDDWAHKDCLFDEPRPEAPDTSDDGDGFSWEKFWEAQEQRLDAKRENFDA